jgi:hypothetical protein
VPGDLHPDSQQIGRSRSLRDQDAVRDDEGGRAEGRGHSAAGAGQIDAGGQGGRGAGYRAIDGGRGRGRSVPLTGRAGRTGADGCCDAAPGPLHNGAPVWYRG